MSGVNKSSIIYINGKKVELASNSTELADTSSKNDAPNSVFVEEQKNDENKTQDSKVDTLEKGKGENPQKQTKEVPKEKNLMEALKNFFNTSLGKKIADKNNDGKVDDEEMKKYIESIKALDGDDSSLSMEDVKLAIEKAKNDESNSESQALHHSLISPGMDSALSKANALRLANLFSPSPSGRAIYSGTISKNYSSRQLSGASNLAGYLEDEGSVENLQSKKIKLQSEIDKKKEEITNINNGSASQVKSAKDAVNQAKEKMDATVENDEKINAELKHEFIENSNKITENDKVLANNASEISKTENSISQAANSVSNLESSLSSLPQLSGAEKDKDKDAKIQQRKTELQSQIKDKKAELENLKKLKEELASKRKELESIKNELENKKAELQEKINTSCSPETKQAIADNNKAKADFEKIKNDSLKTAQNELDIKVTELNKIDQKLQEKLNKKAQGIDFNFTDKMTPEQKADLEKFKAKYEQNKDKYEAVAKKTGVPAELIAALHWRESSGNFNTYMQNGDPLGKPTTHVPAGIYCETWEESAIKAFTEEKSGNIDSNNINTYYDYAERFNGLGYRNKGVPSPYVWSGTDKYQAGKYVADGVYDPTHVDTQLGVAAMLKKIMG